MSLIGKQKQIDERRRHLVEKMKTCPPVAGWCDGEKYDIECEQKELDRERELLKNEYDQLCEDWRQHDKYVLEKLPAAGIVFALMGVALANLSADAYLLKMVMVLAAGTFSFILAISVAKDTYFRDGYEEVIKGIVSELGINKTLVALVLPPLERADPSEKDKRKGKQVVPIEEVLKFPRKIGIKKDIYLKGDQQLSLAPHKSLRCLLDRTTYEWIQLFYIAASVVCFVLAALILIAWIWHFHFDWSLLGMGHHRHR